MKTNIWASRLPSNSNSQRRKQLKKKEDQQVFWCELQVIKLSTSQVSELSFNTHLTRKQTLLKVENRNFSKCSSRDNKTCLNSFQRCCLFLFFIYPPLFTAHLMAYLLHSFFISRLLCGLITTIALLWNSRIIMSFIVLIRVSVSSDLCYVFTVPSGKYMRAAPAPDRWIQTHCR